MLVPSHSPYDYSPACSSHTNESKSKPIHAPRSIFTPDAVPIGTFSISGLRTGSEYASLHIMRQVRLTNQDYSLLETEIARLRCQMLRMWPSTLNQELAVLFTSTVCPQKQSQLLFSIASSNRN